MIACSLFQSSGPPRNAVVVEVLANSALTPWLRTVSERFNDEQFKTEAKRTIYVQHVPMEAGLAVNALVDGETNPALWIPDETVWVDLLEAEGKQDLQGDCLSVVQSPLVIAMWKPLAESLGWPGRKLGWLDVGSLAADPSAWDYYSGGQFGLSLRLGHTHPGISNSGAETLLAVVHAGRGRVAGLWYKWSSDRWKASGVPEVLSLDGMMEAIKSITYICGEFDGPAREALRNEPMAILAPPAFCLRRPGFLAEIAWERLRAGQVDDPERLIPIYLPTKGLGKS